jgi:hypothetical protein
MKKIIVFLTLVFPTLLPACSCGDRGAPCDAAWRASDVFVGKVKSFGVFTFRHLLAGDFDPTKKIAYFEVSEVYRGQVGTSAYVQTGLGGGDCGINFKEGELYLVYALRDGSTLYTGICSRTQPLKFAAEDLEYLRTIKKLPPTSRIFGDVKRYTHDRNYVPKTEVSIMSHYLPPEEDYVAVAPMKGVKLSIRKDLSSFHAETRSNDKGEFEFARLEPGYYYISAELSANFVQFGQRSFHVVPKGCKYVGVRTQSNGWITGKLVDTYGKPIKYQHVEAIYAQGETREYLPAGFTDEQGQFKIGPLPPADYVIGIHISSRFRGFSDKLYYPASEDRQKAKVFKLADGQTISGVVFSR